MDDAYALTKEDIAAIKDAGTVVLFYRPNGDEGCISGMRIHNDVSLSLDGAEQKVARIVKSGLWTRTHVSEHSVDFHRVIEAGYPPSVERHGPSRDREVREAVLVMSSVRYHPQIQTILQFLKAGDAIGVHFLASNNNMILDQADLVQDECYLRVKRGKKTFEFLVDVFVGRDNTARMVKLA